MRIPSLDGLRAISIALVILGHMADCGFGPRFLDRYANFGVQVFFVISGYLITALLLKEKNATGRIDLKAFYTRRILRIFPAAYVFICAMIALYPVQFWDRVSAFTYISNFNPGRPWVLGHLWSLSVEEQFYLLWPCALLLFFSRRIEILVATIVMAPVANLALHFVHLNAYIGTAFPSVADSLALGCLAAIVGQRFKPGHSAFVLSGPLALLLQSIPTTGHTSAAVHVLLLWPLIHVLVALFVIHSIEKRYAWLNFKPLAWVGFLSYSLYLWQQPFLNPERPSFLSVTLILPCAVGSYYLVEKPFLKIKDAIRFTCAQGGNSQPGRALPDGG